MRRKTLEALLEAKARGTPVVLATNLRNGQQRLVYADGTEGELCIDVDMIAAAGEALKTGVPTDFATPAGKVFVQVFTPAARLILVGAVHIAQPLSQMAVMAGYGVTLVDPRRAFATPERFPGFEVTHDWPDEALARLKPDAGTAIVTLTHDPKLDDAALSVALKSPAFYIGSLGSRKTHAARLHRLEKLGFGESELARIHGPVGLDIEAETPAEIAIAILAEITQIRRKAAAP